MAAFFAASVEYVEALTVVLAVGTVRGWRSTLLGSATAVVVLIVVVGLVGSALTRVPLPLLQQVVGVLLLLFGMRWLHKAILRAAGTTRMHDEAAIYRRRHEALIQMAQDHGRLDTVAFVLAFKSVALEGTEVIFIVVALSAGDGRLAWPASIGAVAALALVISLGIMVRRPLSRIPENTLKFVVGSALTAFGTFWIGEGFGFTWPGSDWAIIGMFAGYLLTGLVAVSLCRRRNTAARCGEA